VRAVAILGVILVAGLSVWLVAGTGRVRRATNSRHIEEAGSHATKESERAAAQEERGPPPSGFVRVRGIVIDERRRPLAGARIETRNDAGFCAKTRSKEDGAFFGVVPDRPSARWLLTARTDDGHRADQPFGLRPDLGRIVLRPARDVAVRVTQNEAPVPDARVFVRVYYGWHEPIHVVTTDGDGRATLPIAEVRYTLVAHKAGVGRAVVRVYESTLLPDPVLLVLQPMEPMRVRVVDRDTGEPVAGAQVMVWEQGSFKVSHLPPLSIAPTGRDGWTTIEGVAKEVLRLRAVAEGYPPSSDFGRGVKRPEGVLELGKRVQLRWQILPGDAPVPPDGTELVLKQSPNLSNHWAPSRGHMERTWLAVEANDGFCSPFAFAPDGAIANLDYAEVDDVWGPQPSSFRRPRSLTVRLRRHDGEPAAGVRLSLDGVGVEWGCEARLTDEQGVARWTGIYAPKRDVKAYGAVLGTIDFGDGVTVDQVLDAKLPEPVAVVAKVTLDGKPGLPTTYELWANDFQPIIDREEAEAGMLHCRLYHARDRVEAMFTAEGYERVVVEGAVPKEGPLRLKFPLARQGTLRIVVDDQKPGEYMGHYNLALQRWKEKERRFGYSGLFFRDFHSVRDGGTTVGGVSAGRYRLVYLPTGAHSDRVDYDPHRGEATLRLDFRSKATVRGRVELPPGFSYKHVLVVVEGAAQQPDDQDPHWAPGRPVEKDGSFDYPVPGDRRLALRPTHPLLEAYQEVSVQGSLHGIVLSLLEGSWVKLKPTPTPSFTHRWPSISGHARIPQDRDFIRVRLFFSGRELEPPRFIWDKGILKFKLPAGSKAEPWLDFPGLAPLRLEEMAADEPGCRDFGDVEFSKSTVLDVTIVREDGREAGLSWLEARSLEGTDYVRVGPRGHGNGPHRIAGLLPGKVRLKGQVVMSKDEITDFEREIVIRPGENPIVIRLP
jgi:hypothetical protein